MSPRRYGVLPDRGTLLVFTDFHGNAADFGAACKIFARNEEDSQTHLVFLGDLVHGPDQETRELFPGLYDYPDRSREVVQEVMELRRRFPHRVHLVLGNHDWGHVGGPHPCRFHDDEVLFLEQQLDRAGQQALHRLFRSALLMLLAPCGVLLSHGSPDNSLRDLQQLEQLDLCPSANSDGDERMLRSILTSYGQQPDVTDRLLDTVGQQLGLDLGVVVHGHDRDEEGFFTEYHNQLCPVIFGALPHKKRYLRLDLSARYRTVEDLQEGKQILLLHEGQS